eukprot:1921943-Amphidinium_carterae.1
MPRTRSTVLSADELSTLNSQASVAASVNTARSLQSQRLSAEPKPEEEPPAPLRLPVRRRVRLLVDEHDQLR